MAVIGIFVASAAATAETSQADHRDALEQKVRLLEKYLGSPTIERIEAGDDREAKVELTRARSMLEAARAALAEGKLEYAGMTLNDALRKVAGAASRKRARPGLSGAAARAHFERLRGQIESYIAALTRGARSGEDLASVNRDRKRLEQMLTAAGGHAEIGRYDLARSVLAEAYRLAVSTIAARRKGETAIFRLTFETPADEYEYERKRHESYGILVGIMLSEREPVSTGFKTMVDRQQRKGRHLRDLSDQAAAAGDYPAAIETMEDATRQLIHALRAGGLPVPE